MIKKLTLVAGFGAGYVLGAKAGTQRYDQIVAKFRELSGQPAVQEVTQNLASTASTLADTAKTKVNETITEVAAQAETVDLTATEAKPGPGKASDVKPGPPKAADNKATGTTKPAATQGNAAPMAGAAASDSV